MKKIDQTHEQARAIIEFYLKAKGHNIYPNPPTFIFPSEFVKKHKLGTRWRPNTNHTFDIEASDKTTSTLIEIDDYGKHSKKSQRINDGIINDFVKYHLQGTYELYRLLKEEIVDEKGHLQPTAAEYLKENLF